MTTLILGLILFLGAHSARIVAEPARQRFIAQRGELAWKGLYSAVSIAGFALICIGYGQARLAPIALWTPWVGGRHLAALLTLFAFIFVTAAYVPGNAIKAKLKHPMVLGVKVWALAHLLANHTLADVLLFGGFLLWAVLDFRAARRRAAPVSAPVTALGTVLTVVVGVAAWAGFALWAHAAWIGVAPLGRMAG